MSLNLDKIDFQILKLLQENGRITNLQLSTEIGLSPAPTLERVRKLEISGLIKSYHAIVDEEKLGFGIKAFMLVNITSHQSDYISKFTDQVNLIEEIVECYHITGSSDFMLKIMVKSIKDYESLVVNRIAKIEQMRNLKTMMIMSTVKNTHAVPLGEK
jgi:Lrp/AsnC family transcriptional regulator, leucine-responsive regulatory protein